MKKVVGVVGSFSLASMIFITVWIAHGAATPQAGIASDFITEYPIPTAASTPRNIVVEAPGRVWFTMPGANAVGSLVVTSTTDFEFTKYDAITPNSEPYDLVYDSDRQVIWFTELAGNRIGRLDMATGVISEALIPTVTSAPTGIDLGPDPDDPDGDSVVWFAERDGNKVGYLHPTTMTILDEFTYNGGNAQFADLAVAADGGVWMTAPALDRVVKFTPSGSAFSNVTVGDVGVDPFPPDSIAAHGDNPWVSAPTKGWLGRFAPGTLSLWRWYSILPTDPETSSPTGIDYRNANGRHEVWFVETETGYVGRLVTDNGGKLLNIQRQPLPADNSQPRGIAVDANGHAWITESGSNVIAEWRPPYFYFVYSPLVLKQLGNYTGSPGRP